MGQALLVERVRVNTKGMNGTCERDLGRVNWRTDRREGTRSSWMSWVKFQTKGKDCVKEWTWGVKTDWMLFMISEETARRKEPKVNDWEWSELLLCKEERTNGVTELPLGSEGEWVTKRTDGLKIKTQSLCFHMKDGRSDTFRFVKRSDCSWMRPHTKIHSVWSNELSERNK